MKRLAGHELVRELGRGGMGVVYLARSPEGREVAVKLLSAASAEDLARFERERRLMQTLGRVAGFVPILAHGVDPAGPYVVMPFFPGGALRDRLRGGALGVDASLRLVGDLARALGRAHALGVVHRDVKPENVLFDGAGRPFVADLGLAKHYRRDLPGASASHALTQDGSMVGTLGYAPLEQLDDATRAGPAADVFALGAVLFECLTGFRAFDGRGVTQLVDRLEGEPPSPRALDPRVPAWVDQVVRRALARAPADRFADGAELARALVPARRGRVALAALAGVVVAFTAASLFMRAATPPASESAVVASSTGAPAGSRPEPEVAAPGSAALQAVWSWPGAIDDVAFDPTGRWLAAAYASGTARAWDLSGNRVRLDQPTRAASAAGVAWCSSDRLATAWRDGLIVLVDVKVGSYEVLASLGVVLSAIAAEPGGEELLVVGEFPELLCIQAAGGGVRVVGRHQAPGARVRVSADRRHALTVCDDGHAELTDLRTMVSVRLAQQEGRLAGAFSPDGARVLLVGRSAATFSSVPDGRPLQVVGGFPGVATGVTFLDGDRFAFTNELGWWATFALSDGRILEAGDSGLRPLTALAAHGSSLVATGDVDGQVRLWDASTMTERDPGRSAIVDLERTATGELVSISADGAARRHSASGALLETHLLTGQLRAVAGGPELLVVAWPAGVWSAPRGGVARAVTQLGPVTDLVGDGSPTSFVFLRDDGTFGSVDFSTMQGTTHEGRSVVAIASAPAGALILATADGALELRRSAGAPGPQVGLGARPVALAAAADRLLVARSDGALEVWRVDDALAPLASTRLDAQVSALAISPDGRLGAVVVGPLAKVWSLEPLVELATVDVKGDSVSAVTFVGPDAIVVGTKGGTLRRFDLP